MPIGPIILGAGGYIITATAAAIPWITRIEIIAIIMSNPGRKRTRSCEIAHTTACARIDHRPQEVRLVKYNYLTVR